MNPHNLVQGVILLIGAGLTAFALGLCLGVLAAMVERSIPDEEL